MKSAARALMFLLLLSLGTNASDARDCQYVDAIRALGKERFQSIRGPKEPMTEEDREIVPDLTIWPSKLAMPGARNCDIEENSLGTTYGCDWLLGKEDTDQSGSYRSTVDAIKACLPPNIYVSEQYFGDGRRSRLVEGDHVLWEITYNIARHWWRLDVDYMLVKASTR